MENNPQTIYIVDDDVAVLKAMSRLLRVCGYTVETYSSARDLLNHLPSEASGCALLDVKMPEMDGLELQDNLKARKSRLAVIFMTAFDNAQDRERAMKSGAVAFLEKPLNDKELLAVIRVALKMNA